MIAWGCSVIDWGQCRVPAAAASGVTAIAAGFTDSLAVANGRVLAWGCEQLGAAGHVLERRRLFELGRHVHDDERYRHVRGQVRPTRSRSLRRGAAGGRVVAAQPIPCTVPNVLGTRLARAKQAIASRHCRTGKVRYAYSRTRKGVVISQSRRPGKVLPPGSKVDLAVSRARRH